MMVLSRAAKLRRHHRAAARSSRPTGPCRHSRWRRRTPRSADPAPRTRRATGRTSRAAASVSCAGGKSGHAPLAHDARRDPRADGAHRVAHRVGELHLLAVLEERGGVASRSARRACRAPRCGRRAVAVARVAAGIGLHQQRVEVEIVQVLGAAAHLVQQVGAADHLLQRAEAERGQDLAHLLGDEAEQVDDLLRRAGELRAQRFVLRADADRAGVGMALAHHDAAHGDRARRCRCRTPPRPASRPSRRRGRCGCRRRCASVTRWRRLFSVSTWLASVSPISHGTPAYLIEVCGEAPVPPTWPEIRITSAFALATPAAMVPMPVDGDQLHADARIGIDLLQVVDELRQVLDRIDVVVRRRRDQHHAGRRMAQARDHLGHLEAGQLAALAGLGALRDLDLDLAALVQIFGGHAEAARGHLLDRASWDCRRSAAA